MGTSAALRTAHIGVPFPGLIPALGLAGAAACAATAVATLALGLADSLPTLVLGYTFGVLMGLLGALIARRQPGNRIGWLMCVTALATSLANLPTDYAYAALVLAHGSWPLGTIALWLGGWAWVFVVGVPLPLITVRFPDGRRPPHGRIVDWLAIGGSALFAASNALGPAIPLVLPPDAAAALAPYRANPMPPTLPPAIVAELGMAGLPLILSGYLVSAWSLVQRFRRARSEERTQLKWFALAGILVAVSVAYAGTAAMGLGQSLAEAMVPFELVLVSLPVAIGIAVLRHRLYDIDILLSRALVYTGLTGILGALYVSIITLLERLFISASGQHSDAAYVITAFVVVAAFGPVKDWLQGKVDHRLGGAHPVAALEQFRAEVDVVVAALGGPELACRLLDQAVTAFDARGGAVYLDGDDTPRYRLGEAVGAGLQVWLEQGRPRSGRLVLGDRRGGAHYSESDLDLLRRSAASVGAALSLAAGYDPDRTDVPAHPGRRPAREIAYET